MGRKKKTPGRVLRGPRGGLVRFNTRIEKGPYPSFLHQKQPRGKTAKAWWFTNLLKERAPLVYVFVVNELKRPRDQKDERLQAIIDEGAANVDLPNPPSARELAAYLIERGFHGAWDAWGVEPTYRQGVDKARSFMRRYVHGHADAIKNFREALNQVKPWDRSHVGHDLKYFLKEPGAAAKFYNVLEPFVFKLAVREIKKV